MKKMTKKMTKFRTVMQTFAALESLANQLS